MAKLQPWYKIATPREDLRDGKPLDAAEFAVHLDQVRDGRGSEDYHKPPRFFERTFLTKNLIDVSGQVLRWLAGESVGSSAVFNMTTQFGGGKTHALTLLYHLANNGPQANKWTGVSRILEKAGVSEVPQCETAVFVGTEFDSIQGRGGDDGTPLRRTPWGEIAYQLGGDEAFQVVADHDKNLTAPAGDVIRRFLPQDRPCLILMDEVLNYVSRNRKNGLSGQLYNFLQSLTEHVRTLGSRAVLVVSIPASELEMTAEDEADYVRFKKMLDRLGKAVIMSAESEASEIIRRRLFEWDPRAVGANGRVMVPRGAITTCTEYADWLNENRAQVPTWFSVDRAREAFEATYPFHPMVLSVFERKWQELPRFQQTRGILRLLALWVSDAYKKGYGGAQKEPLIGLGTAPLDDPLFRSAVFEQLGEARLEGAVATDIAGKSDSHADRLDEEAVDTIKAARLHRKVATTIFFESNGGQRSAEATIPEIRLAVAGPDVDLGNVETALEGLADACYYLTSERNRYRFSLKENLNKRYADRRASVRETEIEGRIKEEVQKVFPALEGVDRRFFPENSAQIPDVPTITFVIVDPLIGIQDDPKLQRRLEGMTREHGKSARTFKSGLIWVVPDSSATMKEEARKLLAWVEIRDEGLKLDEAQDRQLRANVERAKKDLKESVWRSYKVLFLLDKENCLRMIDLGLVTSSDSTTKPIALVGALRQEGEIEKEIAPRFLVRNWPPAFTEWSTKSVRDAFFASPQFPRLLYPDSIRETIARGVSEGLIGYGSKNAKGEWSTLQFKERMDASAVEISDEVYILKAEDAEKNIEPPKLNRLLILPTTVELRPDMKQTFRAEGLDQFGRNIAVGNITWTATGGSVDEQGVYTAGADQGNFIVTAEAGEAAVTGSITVTDQAEPPKPPPPLEKATKLTWTGEVPPQKWTNFYMKVLTKLVSGGEVRLNVSVKAERPSGVSEQLVDEVKAALRGLGLDDEVGNE